MDEPARARDKQMTTVSQSRTARGAPLSPRPGLLAAKLAIPRNHPGMVSRLRLLRRLDDAGDRAIVSIVAPAGYGKTSILAAWAGSDGRPVAWLTADEGDNDRVLLFTYLAAAVDRVRPLDPDVFAAIASPSVSMRAAVGRLLSGLSERGPILVAIDDAHRITDHACLDALAELITYLPAGSQVAIAARREVGLPFARWRAGRTLLEIGAGELAMNEDEAGELAHRLGLTVPPEAMRHLVRRTEGWPAMLALAAMAAGRSGGRDVTDLSGGDRPIADYLRSEVLDRLAEEQIVLLTRTSILDHLNGPLCDAVVGRRGSGAILDDLARSTVLVDEYGGSYRIHPLLREFLRDELEGREPERIAELHTRAATWCEVNGQIDAAVEHAFAAGKVDEAARMVGQAQLLYHWSGRRATIRAWLRRFEGEVLERHPWLAVLAGWEELAGGDVAATEHLADIVERASYEGQPPDGTASFESGRAMLRAVVGRDGADDMLANATRAVELEPAGGRWRDYALWLLAMALQLKGDPAAADARLAEAAVAARTAGNTALCHNILGHRALVAIDRHDWAVAMSLARERHALGVAARVEGYLSSALARAADVRIAIHVGDLRAARDGLARSAGLRPLLTAAAPAISVLALLALARAHLAVGDSEGARTVLTQAGEVTRLRPALGVLPGEVALLWAATASLPAGIPGASSLTAAELRVLSILPYYLSFKEIAQRLGVKESTVKTHALAIYSKLGASSRGEAVDHAVEAGLLEPFPVPSYVTSTIAVDAAARAE
jgi:LuxR family transcriptional regulator, maltose regulon positive regulatory protein